jgi:hypothetical protein
MRGFRLRPRKRTFWSAAVADTLLPAKLLEDSPARGAKGDHKTATYAGWTVECAERGKSSCG